MAKASDRDPKTATNKKNFTVPELKSVEIKHKETKAIKITQR